MNYSIPRPLFISADWLLDGLGNAVKDGAVFVDQGKIVKVTDWRADSAAGGALPDYAKAAEHLHFAGGILTPGLFNLHTHIDYTLAAEVYEPDCESNMFDWLRRLVTLARTWQPEIFAKSAARGAEELALAGVSYAVDSSFSGQAAIALAHAGLKGTVGLELFGIDESRAEIAFEHWQKRYADLLAQSALVSAMDEKRLTMTIAPHAPYTVAPALWRKAKDWASTHHKKLLAHIAESRQECQWLAVSEQIVDSYLQFVMPPNPQRTTAQTLAAIDWKGAGLTPVAHLKAHGLLDQNLIAAHCVHMSEDDCLHFARAKASAALCLASNQRLHNGAPDLAQLADAGIAYGLGTDSRASAPDLSPRREAVLLADLARHRQDDRGAAGIDKIMTSSELLRIITSQSAIIAGVDGETGSLTQQRAADICVFIGHSAATADQAHDQIFAPDTRLDSLFVDGRRIVSGGQYQGIDKIDN